jgi:hypothetical protein
LAAKPGDPAASLVLGRFLCLARGEWAKGLPLLAKGSDMALKALADRDLAGATTRENMLALGDAWREYGKAQSVASAQRRAEQRAEHWYLAALNDSKGLARAVVMKRLTAAPAGVSFPKLASRWDGPRARTNLSSMPRPGGQQDVSPAPGLLVGFDVKQTSFRGRPMIKIFCPVYLTEQGKVRGRQFGQGQEGTHQPVPLTRVEAKPGYAVGGIYAHKDERLRGFNIVFMRIRGGILDPDDRYESDWVGEEPADELPLLGGDGRPVVGVQAMSGDDCDAMGLILLE